MKRIFERDELKLNLINKMFTYFDKIFSFYSCFYLFGYNVMYSDDNAKDPNLVVLVSPRLRSNVKYVFRNQINL